MTQLCLNVTQHDVTHLQQYVAFWCPSWTISLCRVLWKWILTFLQRSSDDVSHYVTLCESPDCSVENTVSQANGSTNFENEQMRRILIQYHSDTNTNKMLRLDFHINWLQFRHMSAMTPKCVSSSRHQNLPHKRENLWILISPHMVTHSLLQFYWHSNQFY